MPTTIPIGSPLAVKHFSVATFAVTTRLDSWRKSNTGPAPKESQANAKLKGQTTPDMPFVRINDLASGAGDRVSYDLFNIVQGKPVMGDRKLAGNMMSLTYDSDEIRIDQYRGGIEPGGRMTRKRTTHNLRQIAMSNLAGWANRVEDELCLVHVAGARGYDTGMDWQIPLATDPDFATICVNPILPPTRNRRFFAGDATSVANIDTTDFLGLGDIDRLRAILDELVLPMQPVRIPGDPQMGEDPLFVLYLTSRQWHYLQTATGDGTWRSFLAAAHERAAGFRHPLFMGSRGYWNGILVKKMNRAIRFPVASTVYEYDASNVSQAVTAAVDTDRALLMGAQALVEAYGQARKSGFYYQWHEEEVDHGNAVEISISMIGGKKKVRFDVSEDGLTTAPTDHGVMTIDSYAPDPRA